MAKLDTGFNQLNFKDMDKLFVIAIGGTGMRCLESFVHLCAIGMFDNQEIEILTLDTDQTNGNMGRVCDLIDNYNRIKTEHKSTTIGGTPNVNTFFSAKLNLHKFYTVYNSERGITYRNISKLGRGEEKEKRQNEILSELFLDKETVQEFHLDHGYRAQTHLGSHLMYHAILESARKLASGNKQEIEEPEENLEIFLSKLQKAAGNAKVFVLGSVFGGTGASSIPIIPKALKDAIWIRSDEKETLDLTKVQFGATLLTEYFSFKKPDQAQKKDKKNAVIADHSFFPLNSQAALQFYQNDPTVQNIYKKLYHIGWPLESKSVSNQTITGGKEQKNACHVVELMCAAAAYDFFTGEKYSNAKAECLFRNVQFNDTFDFDGKDFMGDTSGDIFTNKLGAFFSLAHIVLSYKEASQGKMGVKSFITQLNENHITQYNTITDDETKEIDDYLKLFAYDFDKGNFVPGWLYQIYKSVTPGLFIFKKEAFKENWAELQKLDVGELIKEPKHHWDKSGIFGSRYNTFVTILTKSGEPNDQQKVSTTKEKFLAHIYNGITISQKFNK